MPKQSPPVRVADEDWLAGAKLTSYAIKGPGRAVGASVLFDVELGLQPQGGKAVKKAAAYAVAAGSVLRQDTI